MIEQSTSESRPHRMRCMEVWGGNRAIDSGVATPTLDAWVRSEPYAGAEAGGDVHYVSMCAAGKIARFAVADVSGHGSEVDGFGQRLRTLMRKHINTLDQTAFTRTLNEEFGREAEDGIFATAVLATYFAPAGQLAVVNAGHPSPLIYRASEGRWGVLSDLDGERAEGIRNLPLGVIEPTEFSQFVVGLGPGDRVLIYTDAFVERRGPDGVMLGTAGLVEMVNGISETSRDAKDSAFVGALIDRVRTYGGDAAPDDDTTALLLCRPEGEPRPISMTERLVAVARMMGFGGS